MAKVRFLFVDDLEANLRALEGLLRNDEVEIYKATSGVAALDLLLMHEFALAIVDVQMPEMDGFELAKLMRGNERTKAIPIIFVTAGEHDHSRVFEGYEAGPVDFLDKPLDPKIVVNKVRVFFELGRQKLLLNEKMEQISDALAENELARTALAVKNRELEQFTDIASHDLKEPLRTICSYLQLLDRQNHDKLDAASQQYMNFTVEAAKRMNMLIEGLLEYARTGGNTVQFKRIDLNEVLAVALANLNGAIDEAKAQIEFTELPTVMGDREQLVRLLQNLIGNALKFHGEEAPKVKLSALVEDGVWTLSVVDNGIGFSPQSADKLFQVFTRLHGRSSFPGAGIGLAVCKKIVEFHRGKIWAMSEKGKGATFAFTLPTIRSAS